MKTLIFLEMLLVYCSITHAAPPAPLFDLYAPPPTRFELFAPAPVGFELFTAAPKIVDPEKERTPPPLDFVPQAKDNGEPRPGLPVVNVFIADEEQTGFHCAPCHRAIAEHAAALASAKRLGKPYPLPFVMKFPFAPNDGGPVPYAEFLDASGKKRVLTDARGIRCYLGLEKFLATYRQYNPPAPPIPKSTDAPAVHPTRLLLQRMPRPRFSWNPHPADLVGHIREHGYAGRLDGLTHGELELLHDGLHENLVPLAPTQPPGLPLQESRAGRFKRRLQTTRHIARAEPKQFDPFLVVSILGLVWNIATLTCNSGGP